ncbi:Ig-like domain-containing protein [Halococcoides cellulosivorans]|uniref:Uncharacterized protein n=1 Tax=Halococcoides cellulosivorans TaxID=1679096 RepID=A0A2R4X3A8_9EURY|nr:Ig-like domain-containing protein [Halococcoides cellulosivorans]AWB28286.1 hypothetical protein HARCEL1_11510 [Halococcoides cellulosivorans]
MSEWNLPHGDRVRPAVAAAVLLTVLAVVGGGLAASGASTAVTASNETATVAPNQSVVVDLNRTAFGSNATITVEDPSNGSASVVAAGIEYTADPNATGTGRFAYTVETPTENDTGWITVDIDSPPSAADVSVETRENDSVEGTFDVTDPDDETLNVSAATATNGTLTVENRSFRYTPDPRFAGNETVEYEVSDGTSTDTATLTITVEKNQPPIANDTAITVTEGDTWSGSFDVHDPNGDDLHVELLSEPTDGAISVDGTNFTYTPQTEEVTTDGFGYRVSDGQDGATASVSVTIELMNDPPTAANVSVETRENTSVEGTFDVSDPDDETLNVTAASAANGTLTVDNRSFTYTPDPGFAGTETIEYTVSDGNSTATATLTITVVPNRPPIANDTAITVTEGDSWTGSFDVHDPDGDAMSVDIVEQPSHGTVSVDGTNFTYTPETEQAQADAFVYEVTDGEDSATARVNVTIGLVNDPPTAANVSVDTRENESVSGTFDVHDPDDETLNVTAASAANGTLSVDNRSFTYTPDPGFVGTETIAYEVSDGNRSATATLTVTVVANDPPVATGGVHLTTASETLRVPVNASDANGHSLSYAIETDASNGSARIENATLVYDANRTFEGVDRVTVAVSDGVETTHATIEIAVDRPDAGQYATHRTVSVLHGRETWANLLDRWHPNGSVEEITSPDLGEIVDSNIEHHVGYQAPTNTTGTWSYVFRLDTPAGTEIGVVHFAVVRDRTPPEVRGLEALAPGPNSSEVYLETDEPLDTATATFTNESGAVVDRISLDEHRIDFPQDMFAYRANTTLAPGEYDLRVEATDFEGETVEARTTATVTSGGPTIENEEIGVEHGDGDLTGFVNVTGTNVSSVAVWLTGLDTDPIELTRNETDRNRYDVDAEALLPDSALEYQHPMLVIEAHDETGRTVEGSGLWFTVDERPPELSLSATATDGGIDVQVDHSEPLTQMTVRVSGPETRSTQVFEYDEGMTATAHFETLPNGTYSVEVVDARDKYANARSAGPTTVQVGSVPDGAGDDTSDSTGSTGLGLGDRVDIATPTATPGGGAVRTPVDREQTTTTPTATAADTEQATATTTADAVVVQRKPGPTDQGGPGFGVVAALLAVCAAAGLLARR